MIKKLVTIGLFSISILSFAQQKFSIIPSVGYAWRTAKTPSGLSPDTKEYIKGLKSGVNFDISAYYTFNKNMGVGLKFSNYSASSNGRFSLQDINGQVISSYVTTKDNISFFGPAFMISNFNEATKHKLYADVSLGVITYTTKTGSVKGTGSNLGADLNLAYQYAVTKNIYVGPKLGLTGGTLSKMKYNGTTVNFGEDEKEGLGRVSLSAAATFRF
ncbi:porin family protein [Chryseobacterium oryctis]|uniref:Porin family protein n=1 Tax=Chryseobacterium oryctis TaxID=2952618 RepID=A0ABT3HK28_9FLAO|nr:porin family protein [Chryseobacterium oryctis]MCW3160127.1 porin family protein [Chryseobacterium oryctis]